MASAIGRAAARFGQRTGDDFSGLAERILGLSTALFVAAESSVDVGEVNEAVIVLVTSLGLILLLGLGLGLGKIFYRTHIANRQQPRAFRHR